MDGGRIGSVDDMLGLRHGTRMERNTVSSPHAPAPVGAYSPAVQIAGASDMLFVSGQIGLDPESGQMVQGGVGPEAERALQNLEALLDAAGFGLEHVVKCTLYLLDMGDFAQVNELYAARFSGAPPARVTVAVSSLPKGASFEIDAIAAR